MKDRNKDLKKECKGNKQYRELKKKNKNKTTNTSNKRKYSILKQEQEAIRKNSEIESEQFFFNQKEGRKIKLRKCLRN